MIELSKKFRKYGEEFTQLYKDDDIVIYKSTFPSVEVFRYKVGKQNKNHDDTLEMYPPASSFGKWAWCATCRKQFDRILSNHFALSSEKMSYLREICPF